MEESYEREIASSSGVFNRHVIAILIFVGGVIAAFTHDVWIGIAGGVLGLIDDGFRKLKTRVTPSDLSWAFKYGFPRGCTRLIDVAGASTDAERTYLWTYLGYETVVIRLRDGRTTTIGTDQPAKLIAAIDRLRGA